MRLFRRGSSEQAADFWGWWAGSRDRIAQALDGNAMDDRLATEVSRAISTIHRDMAWELGTGRTARYMLCISSEGRPDLRQIALRWLDSAPPADETWEYYAAKQASTEPVTLEVAGARLDLGEMRAISSWDSTRRRVDVRLWHPQYPTLPDSVKLQVGFVSLDSLLGEEDVERWVGQIDLLEAPTGGRTPQELRDEVERRKGEAAGDTWVAGELDGPGGPTIVTADAALKRIDHPFADNHISVGVVLDGPGGLPEDDESEALNREEDDLVARFEGVAVYAGNTIRPGMRTMHFVAQDLERVRQVIDAWAETLPPRRIKVNFAEDMDWSFQRELGLR